jgi:hypothetical protein
LSRFQFLPSGQAFGVPLRDDDGVPAALVGEQAPDAPAAGAGEQLQFALVRLAAQELQHRGRVGRGQPLGFGHGFDS